MLILFKFLDQKGGIIKLKIHFDQCSGNLEGEMLKKSRHGCIRWALCEHRPPVLHEAAFFSLYQAITNNFDFSRF